MAQNMNRSIPGGNRGVESNFSLCLELEQIRDHFYYTNGGHLYCKRGLGSDKQLEDKIQVFKHERRHLLYKIAEMNDK